MYQVGLQNMTSCHLLSFQDCLERDVVDETLVNSSWIYIPAILKFKRNKCNANNSHLTFERSCMPEILHVKKPPCAYQIISVFLACLLCILEPKALRAPRNDHRLNKWCPN